MDHQKETAPIHIAVIGGGIAGLGLPWRTSAKALFAIFSSPHRLFVNLAEGIKPSPLKREWSARGIQENLEALAIANLKSASLPLSPAITNTRIAGRAIGLRPDLSWLAFIVAS